MKRPAYKLCKTSFKDSGYTSCFLARSILAVTLSRDRKHRTLLQGIPLSWYRQLNLKSLSVFVYSTLFIACVIVIGVMIMTLQFGFGSFDLKVPIMVGQQTFKWGDYSFVTIATYLGKTLAVLPLLVFIFVRLNVVFSLLVKNEWFVLVFSTVVLFLSASISHVQQGNCSDWISAYFHRPILLVIICR